MMEEGTGIKREPEDEELDVGCEEPQRKMQRTSGGCDANSSKYDSQNMAGSSGGNGGGGSVGTIPKAKLSSEVEYVDGIITQVLDECFANVEAIKTKEEARASFFRRVQSHVVYFNRIKVLESAYDLRLSALTHKHLHVVRLPQIPFHKKVELYVGLLKATVLDPAVTSCRTAPVSTAVGDMDPRLYVLCYLLSSLSCRRQYNDQLIVPSFCGKSSCGKTKLLEPYTEYSKMVCFEAQGVSRYELKPYMTGIYLNDVSFQSIMMRQNLQVIKNLLRGENTTVKTHGSTQDIGPMYCYMTSNECMFMHTDARGRILDRVRPVCATKSNCNDIEALQCRLLEVYFYRRGQVDLEIFSHTIAADHARVALGILVLQHLEAASPPVAYKTASRYLMPAVVRGLTVCSSQMADYTNVPVNEMEERVAAIARLYPDAQTLQDQETKRELSGATAAATEDAALSELLKCMEEISSDFSDAE